MEDIAVQIAQLEFWSDFTKMAIPGLIGLLTDVATGVIPYFVEVRRLEDKRQQDESLFRREKMSELIDSLSIFSGNLMRYLSVLKSAVHDQDAQFNDFLRSSGQELLQNEYHLKKARAIAGMLGSQSLSDLLASYDKKASEVVRYAIKNMGNYKNDDIFEDLKNIEKDVMEKLNVLVY
ncbi:hypothetical protein [Vreelandella venusta]|uniref:hypothetical protein n=1 Tax=Vreelandella venusta TaxID=44935 RepID=UPI003AA7BC84